MRDPWFESDEGSEIGRLRDANLEKTLKDGPVTGRETRRVLRETVANVVQQRRHSADTIDKVVHAVRNALRNRGVDLKMNDTDLEVEVSRIEKELRRGDGDTHVSVDGTIEKQEFREAEQAETTAEERKENADETGNVRDEAPAQPEQGEAEPAGGEAARPVEAQPQGGEAPRQGAVEPAKTAEPAITIENLSPILKTASVALAENGGDPSDPGHKLKSATKEELLSEQKKILDALNNPDPQAFERFVDKMNRHACKMVEIQEFQNEWRRLHPEVDLESTPLALERKRQELEDDVEHAKEMLSVHPNSKHLKTKLQEAERKLAEFISEHQGKDIETGAETTEAEPARTVQGTQATAPKAETAGVKPPPQTRGNGPASAPEEAGTTTPPRAAKPAGGRKSGDAAVPKENLTAETPAKPVDGDETSATPKPLDGYLAGKKPIETHRIPQSAAKAKPPAAEKPENTTGGGSAADAGRDARKVVGTDYTVARARELLREDVEARIADAAEEFGGRPARRRR